MAMQPVQSSIKKIVLEIYEHQRRLPYQQKEEQVSVIDFAKQHVVLKHEIPENYQARDPSPGIRESPEEAAANKKPLRTYEIQKNVYSMSNLS